MDALGRGTVEAWGVDQPGVLQSASPPQAADDAVGVEPEVMIRFALPAGPIVHNDPRVSRTPVAVASMVGACAGHVTTMSPDGWGQPAGSGTIGLGVGRPPTPTDRTPKNTVRVAVVPFSGDGR